MPRPSVAVKNVTSNERYFIAGPGGVPTLPASILTEAMAQAGAILILYLFVVMLLNVDKESTAARANRYWPWMTAFGILVAGEIVLLVSRGTFPADAGQQPMRLASAGVGALGMELYTKYLLPFEIASIVLLVGLIGAVMLAKIKTKE